MARQLTSGQKAARTRAANKKAREALEQRVADDVFNVAQPHLKRQVEYLKSQLKKDQAKEGQLRTVTVEFAGTPNNRYAYLTRDDSITEGDHVIVISPHPQRNYSGDTASFKVAGGWPVIVKVTSVVETVESITRASKWIIQKIDFDAAIAEEKRREEIALLDARIQVETRAALHSLQLDQLRGLNPELDRLIKLRQSLGA